MQPKNLAKQSNDCRFQTASQLNRSYQQALVDIKQTLKKASPETLLAIVKAEDIAFKVEEFIGVEFRKPTPNKIKQCIHKNTCIHFE